MKFILLSFALLGGLLTVRGQEEATPPTNVEISDPIADSPIEEPEIISPSDDINPSPLNKRTFIPHSLEVRPFTPPPPPVVKRLPAMRVDAVTTHLSKNSRSLTILRGAASTETDLPPPPPPVPYAKTPALTPEEIAYFTWRRRHTINLGATIYDHKISVVNWTDQESLVRYEAVCGFDVGLLAGIGGFVHQGEKYSYFLMHSHFDTTWERRLTRHWELTVPEVAPGEILITRGDVKNSAAIAPMTVIREIIAAETPRLLSYQAARRTYFAACAAWHAANPPIPRDETFILRPHRGSHYLSEAKSITPVRP